MPHHTCLCGGAYLFFPGVDFVTRGEVEDVLRADPLYAGKPAVLCEIVSPSASLEVSSDGYGPVHSLDILTLRTGEGAKVISVSGRGRAFSTG